MINVTCIILAAGQSSRMGDQNKLLLEVQNKSLIKHTVEEALKVDFHQVIIVTGHDQVEIEREVSSLREERLHFIYNPNYKKGMHTSIKTAIKSFQKKTDAFFVCQADQPMFSSKVLEQILKNFASNKDCIHIPTFKERRGTPALIPSLFVEEILEHSDGDFGCAYLMKNHPHKVKEVPVDSPLHFEDIDTTADMAFLTKRSIITADPQERIFQMMKELRKNKEEFCIATVIEVMGSASAKIGSKALFNADGKNLIGWVGGGCAESFIGHQAKEALCSKMARTVLADLDDEIFGLGIACGGRMKVFIEPVNNLEEIHFAYPQAFHHTIERLAKFYGVSLINTDQEVLKNFEQTILDLAKSFAEKRKIVLESMRVSKKVEATFINPLIEKIQNIKIIGKSRITEALARHFTLLNCDISVYAPSISEENYPLTTTCIDLGNKPYSSVPFDKGDIVIIASHTTQDPTLVEKAMLAGANYIGMIGSFKRSQELLNHLDLKNKTIEYPIFIPAGLDINAQNPDEVALSILSEVISLKERCL